MIFGRGVFITLEGIEGAGKTTLINTLCEDLRSRSIACTLTREPGGTALGETIREWLLNSPEEPAIEAELLLLFGARAEHLYRRILPSLTQGEWVLCDRFTDSSYAYQGGGRGFPIERIAELEQWLLGEQRPDLTLILDLPAATGLERAARRRGQTKVDRFEQKKVDFFERARQVFLERARRSPHRYCVLDARLTPAELAEAAVTAYQPLLERKTQHP